MSRKLLPLNALRAFEAAARHLSFKQAGAELNVTPAAISHQVKLLEDLIGAQLFHRMTRALQLTDVGKTALPALTHGLDLLAESSAQMQASKESKILTVSVSPAFGSMWLVSKLDRFQRKHPEIEIRIDGTDRLVDVAAGEVDIAVRYGPGGYKGVEIDYLFNQLNTPVCSPALAQGPRPLNQPKDLIHHTLLHIDWKHTEASWRMWLLAAGLNTIDPTRGPHFMQENMAVQAALDGQGVALVGDRLVAEYLASGDLICPFSPDLKIPLTFSYYLLTAREAGKSEKVSAFRNFLIEEARNEAHPIA